MPTKPKSKITTSETASKPQKNATLSTQDKIKRNASFKTSFPQPINLEKEHIDLAALFPDSDAIDISKIVTKEGLKASDFAIPENANPVMVDLILRSESMKKSERQYWLNLLEVMFEFETHHIKDILMRERLTMAEIELKNRVTTNQEK